MQLASFTSSAMSSSAVASTTITVTGGDAADDGASVHSAHSDLEIELGFVDNVDEDARPAIEYTDPSLWDGGKIGGLPVWLHGVAAGDADLPKTESTLTCKRCSAPMALLSQVYAPVDADVVAHDGAYHRMLYVLVCLAAGCLNRGSDAAAPAERPSVVVLRAQADAREPIALATAGVCAVCGLPATARCARCKGPRYCSKAHQALHWKAGGHSKACGGSAGSASSTAASAGATAAGYIALPRLLPCALAGGAALPEFELVVEPEPDSAERARKEVETLPAAAKAALAAAAKAAGGAGAAAGGAGAAGDGPTAGSSAGSGTGDGDAEEPEELSLSDVTQARLAAWTGSHLLVDPVMSAFQRRVAVEPSQVLRYCRWPALQKAQAAGSEASASTAATAASGGVSGGAGSAPAAPAAADAAPAAASATEPDLDDEDEAAEAAEAAAFTPAPLWVSQKHRPAAAAPAETAAPAEATIPPCQHCGAPRDFEFQLMPQLLSNFDSKTAAACAHLDFGTIAVYTCSRSCSGSTDAAAATSAHGLGRYREEYAWVQPTDDEEEAKILRERSLKLLEEQRKEAEVEAAEAGKGSA